MFTGSLRRVGGSIMLTMPAAVVDLLHLRTGESVGMEVEGGRLVIAPIRKRFTLEELLEQCDAQTPIGEEDRLWADLPSIGHEL